MMEMETGTEASNATLGTLSENISNANEIRDGATQDLHIAVAGCSHGEMDKIYAALGEIEKEQGYKFDLLICCGDFQAVRNFGDLHHMHVKEKFRSIQTFYNYYSGAKTAPILTVFVGGNHEATGYLLELPNGGWVAPNIYYMGFANVIQFAGLRIAGLSGIYSAKDYNRGHFERPPFENGSEISAYHVRSLDIFRLKQIRALDGEPHRPLDIAVSHDWPAGVTDYGDVQQLLRFKPYFKYDIENGKLGNASTLQLLQDLAPRYWLSAHLHCGFAALVPHKERAGVKPQPTRFLALDKPIPQRHFIQAISVKAPASASKTLSYDPVWLAVLRNTDKFTEVCSVAQQCEQSSCRVQTSSKNQRHALLTLNKSYLPSVLSGKGERYDFRPTSEEIKEIDALGDLKIPLNFVQTAPPLKNITPRDEAAPPSQYYRNPQSSRFCTWLGIKNLNDMLASTEGADVGIAHCLISIEDGSSREIEIPQDDQEFGDDDFVVDGMGVEASSATQTKTTQEVVETTHDETTDTWQAPNLDLANFEAPSLNLSALPQTKLAGLGGLPQLKRRKVTDLPEEEE